MIRRIYNLLSDKQRRESLWVGIGVFTESILMFAGVAVLVPVIFLLSERLGKDRTTVLLLCSGVLIFIVLKDLVIIWLMRKQLMFQMRVFRDFSRRMFVNYYHRGLLFLKKKSSLQSAYEVNGVVLIFSQNVLASLFRICADGLLVVMIAVALIAWQPLMGVLTMLLFVPLSMAYVGFIKKRVKESGALSLQAQRSQQRLVAEAFRGHAEIEISNAFDTSLSTFDRNIDSISRNRIDLETYHTVPMFLSEFAVVAGLMLLVGFGGNDIVLTGGVFAVGAFRIIPAIRSVLNSYSLLHNNEFAVDIVEEGLKDEGKTGKDEDNELAINFGDGLTAEHLTFSFLDGHDIFRDLSFTIKRGERFGIRGRSGSGKSTLFNLLLGFFEPTEGRIMIDGVELNASTRRAWHRTTGYVPQEIFIIEGSLAKNIALGHEDIDYARVREVLKQVKLDEWAEELENGLDTDLGEYGSRLSGGQKQRIGIARALYKGARVLFFDEATSSLDSRTEREINDALEELSAMQQELTLIIIAHRETSLKICDRVLDMDSCVVQDNDTKQYE